MLISLCLIAKNEEATIERCIESVKAIVNEIIVIDTGSEDKTIEIAKSIGTKIYSFKWINDFSAARNFAISKANGNWIIFLDGDEYIDKNQAFLLKKHIQEADKKGMNTLLTGLININSSSGQFQSSTKTIKIFKNTDFIQYEGKVHEAISSPMRPLKYFDVSDSISIFHTGYTPEVVKSKNKSERNLKILFQELDTNPNNAADLHFYIAESLMIDKKYSKAIFHLEKAIELDNGRIKGLIHRCFSNILTCMYEEKRDISQFYEVYNRAIKLDSNYPDFSFFLGLRELELKEYSKSIEFLNNCLDKIERYNYDFESRTLTQVFNIYRTLINLNIVNKNNSEVIRLATNILKVDKYDYNTLFILTDILLKNEQVDNVFDFLLKLYDEDLLKDKLYLIKVAESVNKELFYSKVLSLFSEAEKNQYLKGKTKKTSIFLLAYNNLKYTKQCFESLLKYTSKDEYELVVIDNGSTDGTFEWLSEQQSHIDKLIRNEENIGYTKAMNQGILAANYEEIFLLSNDIILTKNWLPKLRKCLYHDPKAGLVVPVCNASSYNQQINVDYKSVDELYRFGEKYNDSMSQNWEQRLKVIPYCALAKKSILINTGMFDERFPKGGSFSDDDISVRLVENGYKLFLCKDTFVHHFGSITVSHASQGYSENLHIGRMLFSEKWGFDSWDYTAVNLELLNFIKHSKNDCFSFLELGTGCGANLLSVKNYFNNVKIYGIEENEIAAKMAMQFGEVIKMNNLKSEKKFRGKFDYIFLSNILNTHGDPNNLIKFLKGYLNESGILIASFMNINFIKHILPIIEGKHYTQTKQHYYSLNEIKAYFQYGGYRNIEITKLTVPLGSEVSDIITEFSSKYGSELKEQFETYKYIVKAKK